MSLCKQVLVFVAVLLSSIVCAEGENTNLQNGKPALIVMDMQNAYFPYMDDTEIEGATSMVNAAIRLFRAQGLPVIRVYHTDLEYGPSPDSEGFQFPDTVAIADEDPMIVKNHPSAFKKTELENILRELNVDTVFLTGLSATGCVLATYYDAMGLELETFMVKGGLISHRADLTDAVEEITGAVGYRAMRYMVANSGD